MSQKINSSIGSSYGINYNNSSTNSFLDKIKTTVDAADNEVNRHEVLVEEMNLSPEIDGAVDNTVSVNIVDLERERNDLEKKYNEFLNENVENINLLAVNMVDPQLQFYNPILYQQQLKETIISLNNGYVEEHLEEFETFMGMSFDEYNQKLKTIDNSINNLSNGYLSDVRTAVDDSVSELNKNIDEVNTYISELEAKYNEFVSSNYADISKMAMKLVDSQLSLYNYEFYQKQLEETEKSLRDKYIEEHLEEFEAFMGMSLDEYNQKLTEYRNNVMQLQTNVTYLEAYDYTLRQEAKEYPYTQLMLTEEYKNYVAAVEDLEKYSDVITDYEYLEDSQICMYSYLYETVGYDAAQNYLEAIEDSINHVKGKSEAEEFINSIVDEEGNIDADVITTLLTTGKGVGDGIETFFEGIDNFFDFESDGIKTDNQYAQMYILEALQSSDQLDSFILSNTYQISTSIGNMLPSMAISTVVSIFASPSVGSTVGQTLMGISAAGNSKNDALINGSTRERAYFYGLGVGVSEAVIGKILGNIPGLNENAKFAFREILSEGAEEFVQEYVDAGLRAIILGETIDLTQLNSDALKSFCYGCITSGVMTGGQTAINVTVGGIRYTIDNVNELIDFYNNHKNTQTVDSVSKTIEASISDKIKRYNELYEIMHSEWYLNKEAKIKAYGDNISYGNVKTEIEAIKTEYENLKSDLNKAKEDGKVDATYNNDEWRYVFTETVENVNKKDFYNSDEFKEMSNIIKEYEERSIKENKYFFLSSEYVQNYLGKLKDLETYTYFFELFKDWDDIGSIPLEFGQYIEKMILDEKVNIGVHRTGGFGQIDNNNLQGSQMLNSIFTTGLRNFGDLSSGAKPGDVINPSKTISMLTKPLDAMILLKSRYKDSTGSVVVCFPSEYVNEKGDLITDKDNIYYQDSNGNLIIKPEYLLGYVASEDGNCTYYTKEQLLELQKVKFNDTSNKQGDFDTNLKTKESSNLFQSLVSQLGIDGARKAIWYYTYRNGDLSYIPLELRAQMEFVSVEQAEDFLDSPELFINEINNSLESAQNKVESIKYNKTNLFEYAKRYLASNVRKFVYKDTSNFVGLNEQIMQNGLYHFTTAADAIIESGYIKASNMIVSYTSPISPTVKSFFFNGVPEVGAIATNLGSIPLTATAVKVNPTSELVNDPKLKLRCMDDMAITYDGKFDLSGLEVEKCFFGLDVEDGKLVYKQITEEVYNNYQNTEIGKTLSGYISEKSNVTDVKSDFLAKIFEQNGINDSNYDKIMSESEVDYYIDDSLKLVDGVVEIDNLGDLTLNDLENFPNDTIFKTSDGVELTYDSMKKILTNSSTLKIELVQEALKIDDPIARVRYLYCKLNQKLHYDMGYIKGDEDKKQSILNQVVTFDNLNPYNVIVCKGWSELFYDLLISSGFNESQVDIVGKNHWWVEIDLGNGQIISTDPTDAINGSIDLANCKAGMATNGFLILNQTNRGTRLINIYKDKRNLKFLNSESEYLMEVDRYLGFVGDNGYLFDEISKAKSLFSNSEVYDNLFSERNLQDNVMAVFDAQIPSDMDGYELFAFNRFYINKLLGHKANLIRQSTLYRKNADMIEPINYMCYSNIDTGDTVIQIYSRSIGKVRFDSNLKCKQFLNEIGILK